MSILIDNKTYEQQAKKLAKKLGFSAVQPYSKLWGTSNRTWGRMDASMWMLTFNRRKNGSIESVEVNTTYFDTVLPKSRKLNAMLKKRVSMDEILLAEL